MGGVWISHCPVVLVDAREGEKEKNVGSVWISRCPVVFIDAGGGKKGNAGGVWISHRPVVLVDAWGGEKKKKSGWHVDITPPRCLCQCLVGERRKTWVACGYHAAPVVFVEAQRGERRKMGAVCGYHVAPLSSSTSGGGRTALDTRFMYQIQDLPE